MNITQIKLQGALDANEWPFKVCVHFSDDGMQFTELRLMSSSCLVSKQINRVEDEN